MFKHAPEPKEAERPWQADIDRMQETLQDVLRAISNLSGVELPDADPESLPRLDFKIMKDRIRNELENFSATTASEMVKQAEEQTREALGAIKSEVAGEIDQIAGGYREKLQAGVQPEQIGVDLTKQAQERVTELIQTQMDEFARWVWLVCKGTGTPVPEQIEKLLEPYVEQASAKLEETIRQKAQELLTGQEQLIQERLQETTTSLENQINGLQEATLQICEQNADSISKRSADQLTAVADKALQNFEDKIGSTYEGATGRFHARLEELANTSQEGLQRERDQQTESLRQKLEDVACEVQERSVSEISTRIEQTAANVVESSVQHLYQQAHDASEHSEEEIKAFTQLQMEEVRGQIKELNESVSVDVTGLAESMKGLDQDLLAIRQKHVAASEEQLSGMIQVTMESLTERLKQIANIQLEEIGKFTRESQVKEAERFESQLHQVAEGQYNQLLECIQKDVGEAGAKAAAEVKARSESVLQELSNKVNSSSSLLKEEGIQASARIESLLKDSLDTYRQQFAQMTESGLEGHRKAIEGSIADLQNRLKKAVEILAPVEPKA